MAKKQTKPQVIQADCRKWLREYEGRCFDLIFCDPPFNIGQAYDAHDDRMEKDKYLKFSEEWVAGCKEALTPGGVLCIHGNNDVSDLCAYYAKFQQGLNAKKGQPFYELARIIWHYRFGQHNHSNWIGSYATCAVYCQHQSPKTWNPDSVLVDSDRASVYGDPRTQTKSTGTAGKRVPFDVWGIPSDGPFFGRVQGNNKERCSKDNGYLADHPNQLPEKFIGRLILAYTNPGDWILDPFGGTGTTCVVAQALGRNCVTIEKSRAYCADIKTRLKRGAVRINRKPS